MKKNLFLLCTLLILIVMSCGENLEERAAREAKEYTERCCPTPVINCTRTDSVRFDIPTRTYFYYCSFTDTFDNAAFINQYRQKIHDGLYETISSNTKMKAYIDAGYKFAYIVRSDRDPSLKLYCDTIVVKK